MSTTETHVTHGEHLNLAAESFFDTFQPELEELFTILDSQSQWSDNLADIVEDTQPWVKGDHFSPESPAKLDNDQSAAAKEIYTKMGLVEAVPIPEGEYDQIIVLGGMQRANELRLSFLKDALQSESVSLKADGGIILWGGRRPLNKQLETWFVHKAKADIDDQPLAGTDPWFNAMRHNRPSLSETELMRLAGLHNLGNLSLHRAHLRFGSATVPISRYELLGDHYDITLLNTPAVQRPQGEPRHTTEACAQQWLEDVPPPDNARVAFVSSNPYIRRTARVVSEVLSQNGRQDVRLVAAGPAAYPDSNKDYLFLGEIARNLYEDSKQTI
ncbi:MAG: hypothetical protein ABIQ89_01325 [Candidatus Saccharimonadales bacterium]